LDFELLAGQHPHNEIPWLGSKIAATSPVSRHIKDDNKCHIEFQKDALQRQNTEISKQIIPEKEYRRTSPNFHNHVSVSDLYIRSAYSAGGNM
jgi:hypothetical protein